MNAWSPLWLLGAALVALAVPVLMVPSALGWQERRRREEEAARRRRQQAQVRIVLYGITEAVRQIGDALEVTFRAVSEAAARTTDGLQLMFETGPRPPEEPPAATPAPAPDTEPPAPAPGARVVPGRSQVFVAPASSAWPTVGELTGGDGWKPLGTALAADGVQFSYGDDAYGDAAFRVDPGIRPAWTAPLPGSELARLFAGEPPYRVHRRDEGGA